MRVAFDEIVREQRIDDLCDRGNSLLDKIEQRCIDHEIKLQWADSLRQILDALKQEALDAHV